MESFLSVRQRLKETYRNKLLPLEVSCKFHEFYWPKLDDSFFEAKPLVLILGQYSTGKTTFIRHLLGSDFPGMQIGPEPTTDKFSVVMYNSKSGTEPGHTAVMDSSKPFSSLTQFGSAFLSRMQCSLLNNDILKTVTLVDTPGILSGENQRANRGYDFNGVIKWFAAAADRILFIFDPHKLDISDEFRSALELFRDFPHKCKIVLNKVDNVEAPALLRIYGALMWNLGQVVKTPEVPRIYVGSFQDHRVGGVERSVSSGFELQKMELFEDIFSLTRDTIRMKLNDVARRARVAKVQAYILSELKAELPSKLKFWISDRTVEAVKQLDNIFIRVQNKHRIPRGDLPHLERMKQALSAYDISSFKDLDNKILEPVDCMVEHDIPEMITILYNTESGLMDNQQEAFVMGSHGATANESVSGANNTRPGTTLPTNDRNTSNKQEQTSKRKLRRAKSIDMFYKLNPIDGKIGLDTAISELSRKCVLPRNSLEEILNAADGNGDCKLDINEWNMALDIVKHKIKYTRQEQAFQYLNSIPSNHASKDHPGKGDRRVPGQKSRAPTDVFNQDPKRKRQP